MDKNQFPAAERLSMGEQISSLGHSALDLLLVGLAQLGGGIVTSTPRQHILQQIEQLQKFANDPEKDN